MKEIFEHEGKKYILIEPNNSVDKTCKGCAFRDEEKDGCVRRKIFMEEHNCSDRTDIFVLMQIPGPKKKLEL